MLDILVPYKEDSVERANNKTTFLEHYSPYFNVTLLEDYDTRAGAYNQAARESTADYIALGDIDAILPYKQMNGALFMLEDGYDLVYPYDAILNRHPDGSTTDDWPGDFVYGMMVFFNRERFIEFGGENEEFIGYGWEDLERYYRALNSGFNVGRVPGECYHLTHPRNGFENPYFFHNMKLMKQERAKWKATQ